MPDKDGVEIYKRFYAWPERFRLGDPVLVKEVTGMRWPDFVAALEELDDDEEPDQVVLLGLIAVAFWQGNPQMSRDKVRRALEKTWQDDVEAISGDEGDADPPAQSSEAGEQPSLTSTESSDSPDASSDETSPNGSGNPGSVTTSPESLPA